MRYEARLARTVGGRTVLVTGASSGIGRALAHQLAEAGARVILVARDEARLERALAEVRERGAAGLALRADLSGPAEVARLVDALAAEAVDVLVNNAGMSIRRRVEQSFDRAGDYTRLVEVNYLGPLALTLGLLPGMLARGRGQVVNVSTIGVQAGAPNFSAYVASKGALDQFARSLMLELCRSPVRVTTVILPLVRTPMTRATEAFEGFPALDAQHAARRIGGALIRRPVRVAPAWSTALELGHVLAPGLMRHVFALLHDRGLRWLGRRTPPRSHRPGAEEEH